MSKMSTADIERNSISSIELLFQNPKFHREIKIQLERNNTTKDIDGFININGYTVDVQAKGTTRSFKKDTIKFPVNRQYLEYAKKNGLLFLVSTNIVPGSIDCDHIYYSFISMAMGRNILKKQQKKYTMKLHKVCTNNFLTSFDLHVNACKTLEEKSFNEVFYKKNQ